MKAKGIIIFKNNATHIIFFTIIKFISFSSSYIGPILTSLFYIPIRTFHFNNCEIMSIDLLHIQTLSSLSFPSKERKMRAQQKIRPSIFLSLTPFYSQTKQTIFLISMSFSFSSFLSFIFFQTKQSIKKFGILLTSDLKSVYGIMINSIQLEFLIQFF